VFRVRWILELKLFMARRAVPVLAAAERETVQMFPLTYMAETAVLAAAAADVTMCHQHTPLCLQVQVGSALLRVEVIPVVSTQRSLWVALDMGLGRLH
jgi:hypothetical protein